MFITAINPVDIQDEDLVLSRPLTVFEYFESRLVDKVLTYYDPVDTVLSTDLMSRLNYFNSFKDNWDGNSAVSLSEDTIFNSTEFLKMLPNKYIRGLNKEDISITPYGTIVIDWRNGDNLISVEIGQESVGLFGEIDGVGFDYDNLKFEKNALTSELSPIFKKLYN